MVVLPLIFATQIFVYPTTSVTEYVMKDSGWFLISSKESRSGGGLHPVWSAKHKADLYAYESVFVLWVCRLCHIF